MAALPLRAPSTEDLFASLFREHWSAVHAYAHRRTGNEADAHDVAAEVFTVAWRRFADVPTEHTLPWLYRTAANVLANRARSSRRRERLAARVVAQPTRTVAGVAETVTEDAVLFEAFGRLPPEQREVLRLVAWEGLGNDDLAVVLGVSPNAAALRVSRARARFADALATIETGGGHEAVDRTGGKQT